MVLPSSGGDIWTYPIDEPVSSFWVLWLTKLQAGCKTSQKWHYTTSSYCNGNVIFMHFILPLFQCYSVDVYAERGSWKYPIDESVSSFCVSCLTKLQTADIPKWKAKYQRTAWGCFFVVEREIIHSKWVLWPLDTSISNCRSAEDPFIIFISAGVYSFPACIHSDQRANFESFFQLQGCSYKLEWRNLTPRCITPWAIIKQREWTTL